MQYQTLRSVTDNHVFVVCQDGRFYELVPDDVRKQGPWQNNGRGQIEALQPQYRLALGQPRRSSIQFPITHHPSESDAEAICAGRCWLGYCDTACWGWRNR